MPKLGFVSCLPGVQKALAWQNLGLVSSLPGVQKALERQNLDWGEQRALRPHEQYVAHAAVCPLCSMVRACRPCIVTATRAPPGQNALAWTLVDSHVRDSPACINRISPTVRVGQMCIVWRQLRSSCSGRSLKHDFDPCGLLCAGSSVCECYKFSFRSVGIAPFCWAFVSQPQLQRQVD